MKQILFKVQIEPHDKNDINAATQAYDAHQAKVRELIDADPRMGQIIITNADGTVIGYTNDIDDSAAITVEGVEKLVMDIVPLGQ